MHESAMNEAKKFAASRLGRKESLRILDVGSQDINGSLRDVFEGPWWNYTGMDIAAGKNVDIVLTDPYKFPFPAKHFDVVVSSSCMEHVPLPWKWMPELVRVCKRLIFITVPNRQDYHAYPVDCWRCWPDGMRALMEDCGLRVLECYDNERDTVGIAEVV